MRGQHRLQRRLQHMEVRCPSCTGAWIEPPAHHFGIDHHLIGAHPHGYVNEFLEQVVANLPGMVDITLMQQSCLYEDDGGHT